MLSLKQEQTVSALLQELKNLQIKTRFIESAEAKGLKQTEDQEDLQVAMESVRLAVIAIAKAFANMFESKGFDFFAEKIEKQTPTAENLEKELKELEEIMAAIQREAEKRFERSVQRRKRIEAAEKQAEQSNEKERLKQAEFTSKVAAAQKGTELQRTPFVNNGPYVVGLDLGNTRYKAFPTSLMKFIGKRRPAKRKSNLIQVKSSEAKERDFANQRALKKHDMTMAKSAPVFGPSQMSR